MFPVLHLHPMLRPNCLIGTVTAFRHEAVMTAASAIVIFDRFSGDGLLVDVRFTPRATEVLHCLEMTRRAQQRSSNCQPGGGSRAAFDPLFRTFPAKIAVDRKFYKLRLFQSYS
jgi:hypothetical protein